MRHVTALRHQNISLYNAQLDMDNSQWDSTRNKNDYQAVSEKHKIDKCIKNPVKTPPPERKDKKLVELMEVNLIVEKKADEQESKEVLQKEK